MPNIPHSGTIKAIIVNPIETRTTGPRILVSDPAVRSGLADILAKLDEILTQTQEGAS